MARTIETTEIPVDKSWNITSGITTALQFGEDSFLNDGSLAAELNQDLISGTSAFGTAGGNNMRFTDDYDILGIGGDELGQPLNCSAHIQFLNEMKRFFSPSQIVVPIIFCVICLIGLVGNGLVMFVLIGSKEMTKSVANIYILNLAVADTLLLVTLPFSSTQRVLLAWPFGVGMCKIVEAIKYLNYFASIFFLTAMSIDRYFAVAYVVTSSRYRTNRNTLFVCLLVWGLSLAMVIPLLIYTKLHGEMCALIFDTDDNAYEDIDEYPYEFDMMDYGFEDFPCSGFYSPDYVTAFPIKHSEGYQSGESFQSGDSFFGNLSSEALLMCQHPNSRTFHLFIIFTFVIGFVAPFTIITLCYAMIVVRVLRPSETRSRSRQADRTRRRVTRMVVALVVIFFVCWLPFYVWHLVQIRGIQVSMGACANVRDFTFCLCFANSCLNPLLYTFLGHNFQERLRKSIALTLRSWNFSKFARRTTATMSRDIDTGNLSKKMEATRAEADDNVNNTARTAQPLSTVPEEEQCLNNNRDAKSSHQSNQV